MLFMGEEWGASTPWQFFTSHPEPELGRATAEGRIAEFARMGWDARLVPDPQDPATFERSLLDWDEPGEPRHARLLELHRRLVRLRREHPELTDPRLHRPSVELVVASDEPHRRAWRIDRGAISILINLTADAVSFDVDGEVLLSTTAEEMGDGRTTVPPEAAAIVRR